MITFLKVMLLYLFAQDLLRELRIAYRQAGLRSLEKEFGRSFSEVEVWGDELKSLWP